MNIQMHLQKRLQLCPSPLWAFHKHCKREISWQEHSSEQKVFKKLKVTANVDETCTLKWNIFASGADSGSLQSGSRNFSYDLLTNKAAEKRAYFDKLFSRDFWKGKYKCEKKRQTLSLNYSVSIVREETWQQAKPEGAATCKPSPPPVCYQQTSDLQYWLPSKL